jgi:peptide subunit release factor 1 (eRF1)
VLTVEKRTMGRAGTLKFLGGLAAVQNNDSITLYLPPDLTPAERRKLTKELPTKPEVITEIEKAATGSQNGIVVFWGSEGKYCVLPPFPITESHVSKPIDTLPLFSLLSKDYLIAMVLVRLGSYGIGVFQGEKKISSKVGTGLVHGRHRQGGSSAHRFERHRDKQIEYFLTRACRHAREQIEPYVKSIDYIVYGGARTTIQLLQKQCPLLGNLKTPTLPPRLDIPEPRQAVLEAAVRQVWSSTVYEWQED